MRRSEGFTLLEVMVALAIALPALLLLYRQGGTALDLTGGALATQEAISRAESHLAALTPETLAPGDREGDDGGTYRWRVRVEPIGTAVPARTVLPPPSTPASPAPFAGGTTLYAVSVSISWRGPRGTQAFTLQTRRLGPATASPP